MKRIKLNDNPRYLLFFNDRYGGKMRVDFSTKKELDGLNIEVFYPPVYLFKKDTALAVHGKAGLEYVKKLIFTLSSGITVIKASEYNKVDKMTIRHTVNYAYHVRCNNSDIARYLQYKDSYLHIGVVEEIKRNKKNLLTNTQTAYIIKP